MAYPLLQVLISVAASNALMVPVTVALRVMKPCMVVAKMDSLLLLVLILLAAMMIQVSNLTIILSCKFFQISIKMYLNENIPTNLSETRFTYLLITYRKCLFSMLIASNYCFYYIFWLQQQKQSGLPAAFQNGPRLPH